MKQRGDDNIIIGLFLITILSVIWVFCIPGYIAYKNNVFYGWEFKNNVSDSAIYSKLRNFENNLKFYSKDGLTNKVDIVTTSKITFAGFAENGLNFVWLESYVILASYIFLLYTKSFIKFFRAKTIFLSFTIYILFHFPNWIRNFTDVGQHGRTIYSFVNYDIDKVSWVLQEFRGVFFSILLGIFYRTFESINDQKIHLINEVRYNLDYGSLTRLMIETKKSFFCWQRDILATIVLFLPWTWFYWRNISYHGDSRYIFSAVIFHFFWICAIICVSLPFTKMATEFQIVKSQLMQDLLKGESNDRLYEYVINLEALPKSQFVLTALTTLLSLLVPFLQILFEH